MSTLLIDPRKISKVKLPSFPEVEVELYSELLTGQIGELNKIKNDYDRGIETLRFLIKTWSFVDKEDKILEISKETLSKLPAGDFTVLMNTAVNSLDKLNEKKKKKLKK